MEAIKEMFIGSEVPSTLAVMDYLKSHDYPECDYTEITCCNGSYGGMISSYIPHDEFDFVKEDIMQGAEYKGMYRMSGSFGSWFFYMPEVDKYYFMTI